jgi:hypothetical protein
MTRARASIIDLGLFGEDHFKSQSLLDEAVEASKLTSSR